MQHVDRTAATAHESAARQFAAAGQVQHSALGHLDHLALDVLHAIHRAAIGHDKPVAADGRQAARQEPDGARGFRFAFERNAAQRGAQHPALLDQRRSQRDGAERGIRRGRRVARGAPKRQDGIGVVFGNFSLRPQDHVFAHGDDAARPGDRVDLRGAQRQPIGGGQFGVQAAVTEPRGAQAHVTPHVQLHIVKADQVPAAPHIQQAGRHVQPVTDVEILQRRGNQLQEEVGAVQRLVTRLVEQDVGRGQAHLAGGSRGIDQRQRPRQPQALAHGQRDAAISAHVGIHRQP
ncbi:hypothetical protein G6F22_015527 [Rhizopus arrhizus]|nr:hypothetical protein G6F22_015527 [Rhizopus arrhizus]